MQYTLRGKIANITPLTLDKTLSLEGASADAKAVGEAIAEAKRIAKEQDVAHANLKTNPHNVTVEQLGLDKVDNTSDMDKPVSNAQAEAIADAKKAGTDAQTAAENAQKTADEAKEAANTAGNNAKEHATEAANTAEQNAKNYADSLRKPFTVSLSASGWSETAPFTQTVAVEGILGTDTPHWGVVYSSDKETALKQKESFAVADDLDTSDGSVKFTCLEEKPEVDLTIQMEVNR
jgi:hypothetical protein